MDKTLKEAAAATPDPDRAYRNLRAFISENAGSADRLSDVLRPAALLFCTSQFLANFSVAHPGAFFDAVRDLAEPVSRETARKALDAATTDVPFQDTDALMAAFRDCKKRLLLRISLRDILGRADIVESMAELSALADVLTEGALGAVDRRMKETYGEPAEDAFSVISVGKLGSEELNFSSDIDLLYVYRREEGETSGIASSRGIVKNRISNHEYYCKLGEQLNRFLSAATEDGFVYRVDLRLRPQGQKGSLAVSLFGYEVYYESWGQAWERAVLLRARPAAGDVRMGREFLDMVRPFVYRKYLDHNAIEEIRRMKTKIDEAFKKDDIKRGYGGIREIEFFVHALQLLYGGKEPLVRDRSTLTGLHRLMQKNFIGPSDCSILSDHYRFLRRLEHRLQQLNDLQTHSLPSGENDLAALGRKMGFPGAGPFQSDLERRRREVRRIYDSLFSGGPAGRPEEADRSLALLSEDLSDNEARDLLAGVSLRDPERAARNIRLLRDSAHSFQTLRGQRLLNRILPAFLREALLSVDPDAAINNLQAFGALLASEESYLDLFAEKETLIPVLVRVFSRSDFLAKAIVKRLEYLDLLGHELFPRKTLRALGEELRAIARTGRSVADAIRILKQKEEIRLGVLFLDRKVPVTRLTRELTKTAESILSVSLEELGRPEGLAVIGLGKAGGRELTFGSDLDLVFVADPEATDVSVKAAERLIRLLISYTQDGTAYGVDTRLRPEGSKGPLVPTIAAFRDYYRGTAHPWELQALLKARPVAGSRKTGRRFMELRAEVLRERGTSVTIDGIRFMRERIERELSKEGAGLDIKLGPGGLEELEFTVQYLQLSHCREYPALLVQGTLDAIRRLSAAGVVVPETCRFLGEAYILYRTAETALRLLNEPVLKEQSPALRLAAEMTGYRDSAGFLDAFHKWRKKVREFFGRL